MPRLHFVFIVNSVASVNYSGPEDVDLTLPCDDSVAPFLVELSVKRQSARLTCLEGSCVAKSMGIGPGGTIKLKNGRSKLHYLIYYWPWLFPQVTL